LVAIFGALSPHPKIPFPAAGLEREVRPHCARKLVFCAAVIPDLWVAPQLFRIEAERRKLLTPFSRWIAEALDADAAGQATSHCCFHKIGSTSLAKSASDLVKRSTV
jgi:hypothetical protein